MAKLLPLGLQSFREIIEGNYLYVDKTHFFADLKPLGRYLFLARPRRFGKSITLSILKELYSGNKELFSGLSIASKWNWERTHPVIHLNFTGIGVQEKGLEYGLNYLMDMAYQAFQIPVKEASVSTKFEQLLIQAAKKNKVVVLIDEYDAPITQFLGTEQAKALNNRELLKEFFSVLKKNDNLLELVFITGVSKFSKVGIFSGLNNLTDLSMHPAYATMLGYTQKELEDNFAEHIDECS
jgi:Predicted AAA-ATPase